MSMLFVYSVKYVCGTQTFSTACTPVSPGTYATEINIHNFHPTGTPPAHIQKRILQLVLNGATVGLEPTAAPAQPFTTITLPPDSATMDDCCNIGGTSFKANTPNIGFLELLSDVLVNVTAVYTATQVSSSGVSSGISIDVLNITHQQI
jgi:hypothetical protein